MRSVRSSSIARLNPAIPRRYLFVLAGALWTVAGAILCIRASTWLHVFSLSVEILFDLISLLLMVAGYLFVFARLVQKNIERIMELPDRVCLFAFTPWRGYAMITFMVALGITLRDTIPGYYLAIPYAAMGGTLILGSLQFYRRFFLHRPVSSSEPS